MTSYNKLMEKYREIVLVNSAEQLLEWDLETYMPPNGLTLRSDQMGVLKRMTHRMLVSEELAHLLKESEDGAGSLDEVQRRNLYLLRREHDIEASVSEDLVADLASQSAVSRAAWLKAKMARNWALFEPELQKLVDLCVKRAEATMHARGVSCAYDAMIDDSDKGMTHQQVGEVLTDLMDSLVPLIRKYQEASNETDRSFMRKRIPLQTQREIVRDATGLIGFDARSDNAWGRIDDTEHGFTSGYFDDLRIAIHYLEDGVFESLFCGLHEAGHGLYERNLNREWMYQPVGRGASGGMHETMSRFAENIIGRSRAFWSYYLPRMKALADGALSDVGLENLLRAINKVEPSKIRVDADEVTYSLHIVIRSEIERRLFEGDLPVSELPHVWNELYKKYLQLEIANDGEGVLQDIHWSTGYFGGFQSYALGNIYGGMFLQKMEQENSAWSDEVEKGRPGMAIGWLRDNVQRWGAMYDPPDLVRKVTGTSLTPQPFARYLSKKLSSLWG